MIAIPLHWKYRPFLLKPYLVFTYGYAATYCRKTGFIEEICGKDQWIQYNLSWYIYFLFNFKYFVQTYKVISHVFTCKK